jgi:hypothetical protein
VTAVGSAGILPAVFPLRSTQKKGGWINRPDAACAERASQVQFGAGDVDDQTIIGTAPCQNAG